jgi:hypothetical protein
VKSIFRVFAMMVLLVASAAGAAPNSEAIKTTLEALPTCGNFVRFDDTNVYTGFGPYWTSSAKPRVAQPAKIWAASLDGLNRVELATLDSAVDLMTEGDRALVLTYSGIEDWSLSKKTRSNVYPTVNRTNPLGDEEHARSFARYGNKLVIAHGRVGVTFFDLKSKAVTKEIRLAANQGALESVANGVSISGKYAYVVLDSYTLVGEREKPAFRGIAVIDMDTETVVSELDGMDPGADSVVADGNRVIVSFYGQPLWKYAAKSLLASALPAPLKRVWKFPVDGRGVGAAAVDDKYYYTCFSRMPGPGEGSYYKKVPMVLDRRVLMLD